MNCDNYNILARSISRRKLNLHSITLYTSAALIATRIRYPAWVCQMVLLSPRRTGWIPPGIRVFSHTKSTQTSVPTRTKCAGCIYIYNRW